MVKAIGIDFGTTNSVVALLHEDGSVTTRRHATLDVFRSVLCFWTEPLPGRTLLHHAAGPEAITAYLEDPLDSRLIMSMKTYLAQKSFTETRIFGHPLHPGTSDRLRSFAPCLPTSPFHRASSSAVRCASPAISWTMRSAPNGCARAYADAGWHDVRLALEPEAAGTRFARTLTEPATLLIGDFGGGTSDFSIMRFDPGAGTVAARPCRHRHRRRCVRLPHHRPRHRTAARQGRHLPGDGQAPAGAAGVLLRLRALASAVPDAHAAHAALDRRGGAHRAAPRASAQSDRVDRGWSRLPALSGGRHHQGGAVAGRQRGASTSATRVLPWSARITRARNSNPGSRGDLARLAATVDQVLTEAATAGRGDRPRVPHRRHGLRARRPPAVRTAIRRRRNSPAAASSSRSPKASPCSVPSDRPGRA